MPERKKILYVEMAHGMGGSLVSLYQLIRGLDQARFEPILLFYWDNPYLERFRELGVETIVWSGPRQESDATVPIALPHAVDRSRQMMGEARWLPRLYHGVGFYARILFQTLPLAWRIYKIIRGRHIDLVHANDLINCNREVILAARLAKCPCVCHIRAFEHYTHFDRMLVPFVDRFIFISQAIAQDSTAQGADPTKAAVVYNALDMDEYLQTFDDGTVRAALDLDRRDLLVGIVGRIVPWKGQRTFIEAMAQVAKAIPNVKCVIIGDAATQDQAYKRELQELVATLGLQDVVHFLGWRSDIPQLLSALDVLVHASLEPEPFGRVLIEGMAASRPVIAANGGACPEIIEDGVSGLLFPPGDATALAECTIELLGDPDRRETMGIMARHQAQSRFSIAEHVQHVQREYDALLQATRNAQI